MSKFAYLCYLWSCWHLSSQDHQSQACMTTEPQFSSIFSWWIISGATPPSQIIFSARVHAEIVYISAYSKKHSY